MADPDIFVWLGRKEPATREEIYRAATIVADRLCGSVANPIIRNAQEERQLAAIKAWLERRGYRYMPTSEGTRFDQMAAGTFSFRMNVPVKLEDGERTVNIPVDVVVMPKTAKQGTLPVLFHAQRPGSRYRSAPVYGPESRNTNHQSRNTRTAPPETRNTNHETRLTGPSTSGRVAGTRRTQSRRSYLESMGWRAYEPLRSKHESRNTIHETRFTPAAHAPSRAAPEPFGSLGVAAK